MNQNISQAYQKNSIYTASKGELTLMLYNGAIKFCNQTIEALEKGDYYHAHVYNIRIQDIIGELQATLNPEYPIAKEYRMLYEFINELLVDANISKDYMQVNEAKNFIIEFRDLWKEVMKKVH